jgi:hypothetical protein
MSPQRQAPDFERTPRAMLAIGLSSFMTFTAELCGYTQRLASFKAPPVRLAGVSSQTKIPSVPMRISITVDRHLSISVCRQQLDFLTSRFLLYQAMLTELYYTLKYESALLRMLSNSSIAISLVGLRASITTKNGMLC